jgi:hypothetical protein
LLISSFALFQGITFSQFSHDFRITLELPYRNIEPVVKTPSSIKRDKALIVTHPFCQAKTEGNATHETEN